ncbi:MAG: hypothetical protein GKS02_05695 [Alphaproteobacteria bacterium]|nr:hypothetical protein [Alphaproteobacteria bacterium]
MTMGRAELKQVIDSSRALAFNCHEIGSRIPPEDAAGKRFNNKLLNNSLFIKTMERYAQGPATVSKMRTLIYFPYDLSEVAAGGDSIWKSMIEKFGERLNFDKFTELMDTLLGLFDVRLAPTYRAKLAS